MSDIEIFVPFGLPPAEHAADLLRELQLPALAMLLARARRLPIPASPVVERDADASADWARGSRCLDSQHDGFARALPHEMWLARHFGLADPTHPDNSPPVAAALMRTCGIRPDPGHWFIVQPVHYHVARDHLVLTDPRALGLADGDARALFATALRSFEQAGLELRYGNADYWFVRADRHRDLLTATPDATCGHNIHIWMPEGTSARAWRKLQNEVQMDWHTHSVNAARTEAGRTPVNSLWLWGGAGVPTETASKAAARAESLFNFQGWYAAFGQYTSSSTIVPDADAQTLLASSEPHRFVMLDSLIGPALAGDWASWLEYMRMFEVSWFGPILRALHKGDIASISLIVNHNTRLRQWRTNRNGLRKIWQKPALNRLLS